MRILLFKINNQKKFLVIKRTYSLKYPIIPIGYDCHPAYVLAQLRLRQHSLPFDWVLSDSVSGMEYYAKALSNNCADFLVNLRRNEQGRIYSGMTPPYIRFDYVPDLIENEESKAMFIRRIERVMKIFKSSTCTFLFNLNASRIDSFENANSLINSAQKLSDTIKSKDKICIYIRYDEDPSENKSFIDIALEGIKKIKKIRIVKYVRGLEKNGIWGNVDGYLPLLKSLKIEFKLTLPKVYIE